MNEYTVTEIAKMLNKDPETVRRWIREGKLKADQASRKSGNRISSTDLDDFLLAHPKYAANLSGSNSTADILSALSTLGTLSTSLVSQKIIETKKGSSTNISLVEVINLLNHEYTKCEDLVAQKKEAITNEKEIIAQLEKDLSCEEQRAALLRNSILKLKELDAPKKQRHQK